MRATLRGSNQKRGPRKRERIFGNVTGCGLSEREQFFGAASGSTAL